MKQPREGITGTDRYQDDLLSLEDAAIPRRVMMTQLAVWLRTACVVGNPAPVVARMWERMSAPRPGDLVVETSTLSRTDREIRITAFGILLEHRTEWDQTDEEWGADLAEQRASFESFMQGPYSQPGDTFEPGIRRTEHAWYIQYGPKATDIYRWYNCGFMVIPVLTEDFRRPAGLREGNHITFTRASLLDGLSDSGFTIGEGS